MELWIEIKKKKKTKRCKLNTAHPIYKQFRLKQCFLFFFYVAMLKEGFGVK
jgi:hypothetical protein